MAGLAAATPLAAGQDAATPRNPLPVRSSRSWGLSLVAEGTRRSVSFRALVEALRRTNLVIYVEPALSLPGVTIAATQFLGVAGEYRYLRITIDVRAPRTQLIALLGHELHHALEIGAAPEVVDQATLAALFRRIGHESMDGYDTTAASTAGARVLTELWKDAR